MRILFIGHLKIWYFIRYIASRILLTPTTRHVNIECMRYVIVFTALFAIDALLFIVSRKRNRRMRYERLGLALKRHVNQQTKDCA